MITPNQVRILRRLAAAGETPLTPWDMRDAAPEHISSKGEWAMPVLRRLEKAGLARKSPVRLGNRSLWTITEAGRTALAESVLDDGPTPDDGLTPD